MAIVPRPLFSQHVPLPPSWAVHEYALHPSVASQISTAPTGARGTRVANVFANVVVAALKNTLVCRFLVGAWSFESNTKTEVRLRSPGSHGQAVPEPQPLNGKATDTRQLASCTTGNRFLRLGFAGFEVLTQVIVNEHLVDHRRTPNDEQQTCTLKVAVAMKGSRTFHYVVNPAHEYDSGG
ncbi:unnamed protein product [Phytophthora lilii]|uniref:Unnamed protein product n=1 Tax=Phytophthora lilii TaxID=2077276 RepID=A0A9W6UEV7_9STRA|nr:unnamed protein product [Phytophthora lilii]